MAVYTTTLFELSSSMTSGTIQERTQVLQKWLFNENFGLTPDLASVFEPSFIRHYLFSEIGYETPEMFRNRVHVLLYGKATYYNELWELNNILTTWNLLEDDIDLRKDDSEHTTTQDTEDRSHNRDTGEREAYGEKEEEKNESASDLSQESEDKGNNQRMEKTATSENNQNNGTITDVGFRSSVDDMQGNGANSNFPQANIIAGRDYYTDGRIENSLHSINGDESNTRTLDDGYIRGQAHGREGEEILSNRITGGQAQSNIAERSRESARDRSRKLEELVKEMVNKAIQAERQLNSISRGRSQRRQVPELVKMISEGFIHVPLIMIRDQAENFMGVW